MLTGPRCLCAGLEEGSRVSQWIQPRPLLGRRTTKNTLHSGTADAARPQPGTAHLIHVHRPHNTAILQSKTKVSTKVLHFIFCYGIVNDRSILLH